MIAVALSWCLLVPGSAFAATQAEKLKDIRPGDGSDPSYFTNANGTGYFMADKDGIDSASNLHSWELWKTDGTTAGTTEVEDFGSTTESTFIDDGMVAVGDRVYFDLSKSSDDDGSELWTSLGSAANTEQVKDIDPRAGFGSSPRELTAVGDVLYFSADDGTNGVELWRSQGTESTTEMVADINDVAPGENSRPQDLVEIGGDLVFSAYTDAIGRELYISSPGGTTSLLDDANATPGVGSDPYGMVGFDDEVFYAADDGSGYDLFHIDPSSPGGGGTKIDLNSSGSSEPSEPVKLGDALYFFADGDNLSSGGASRALWKIEGTAGAAPERVWTVGSESVRSSLVVAAGKLFFTTGSFSPSVDRLWTSDGTNVGTIELDTNPDDRTTKLFGEAGGRLFFYNAGDLWETKGTQADTVKVYDDIRIDTLDDATPVELNGEFLFAGDGDGDSFTEYEPWLAIPDDAPSTTITSGPPDNALIRDATPTYGFSSDYTAADFECRIYAGSPAPGFAACSDPDSHTPSNLADGTYTFEVRAVDAVDGPDPTPASRMVTVDTQAPETSITSAPPARTANNDPSFDFTSSESAGDTFECRLDSDVEMDFSTCDPPKSYTDLPDGSHTFDVRATDAAGNLDQTPASATFTVDTTGPATTITAGPSASAPDEDGSVSFSFTSESGATFVCSLDDGAFSGCESGKSYDGLSNGAHRFRVQASDDLGNLGEIETRNFEVQRPAEEEGGPESPPDDDVIDDAPVITPTPPAPDDTEPPSDGSQDGNGVITDLDATAKKKQKQKGKKIKVKISVGAQEAITARVTGKIKIKGTKSKFKLSPETNQIDAGERTVFRLTLAGNKKKTKKAAKKISEAIKKYKEAPRKKKKKLAVKAPIVVAATDTDGSEQVEKRVVTLG